MGTVSLLPFDLRKDKKECKTGKAIISINSNLNFIFFIIQKLPQFKGKNRIIRAFFSNFVNSRKDIVIAAKHGLQYCLPNLRESIAFSIFAHGEYEPGNINFIIQNLPQNGIFLDLGANIGSLCIPIAKRRPDIRIIAVEASPRVFSYLKRNIELNHITNIEVVNLALFNKDDEVVMFYSPEEKFGKGSMSPVFSKVGESVKTIKVDTLLANRNIANVDFIKIDVEGYESFVFKGATELLSTDNAPRILFEFAHWAENLATNGRIGEAQKELFTLGYSVFNADDPNRLVHIEELYITGTHMLYAKK